MKVAFLGLGAIGAPMARHLAPHYTLSVWNRTASRATDFARENNARAATSPADAVRGAAIAITCLPTSREVESLLDERTKAKARTAPLALFVLVVLVVLIFLATNRF